MHKVILIGLDGATLDLIEPWARQGHLPTFKKIIEGGAYGPLKSTIPATTPTAWTSMITGMNPGKHGIFGFNIKRAGRYEFEWASRVHCKAPSLAGLLTNAGKQVIMVDVPFTYPPEPSGIIVSGMGTPSVSVEFTNPHELKEEILGIEPGYMVDVRFPVSGEDRDRFIDEVRRHTEQRAALLKHLIKTRDWDFLMMVFTGPDRLQHVFWHCIDPEHLKHNEDEAKKYGHVILDLYREIDSILGEIIKDMDNNTTLLLSSDHGFGPTEKTFILNKYLQNRGYLHFDGNGNLFERLRREDFLAQTGEDASTSFDGRIKFEAGASDSYSGFSFELKGLDPKQRYRIKCSVQGTLGSALQIADRTTGEDCIIGGLEITAQDKELSITHQPKSERLKLFICMTTYGGYAPGFIEIQDISIYELENWERTTVFGPPIDSFMFVNTQDYPYGIILEKEYNSVVEKLCEEVLSLYDSEKRQNIFSRAFHKSDIYWGPHLSDAPDVVLAPNNKYSIYSGVIEHLDDYDHYLKIPDGSWTGTGDHRINGIFMAYGENIKSCRVNANIWDVCPTVLAALGVGIPADMDGCVVSEIFKSVPEISLVEENCKNIKGKNCSQDVEPSNYYSKEEEEQIEERLRQLGYLE